MNIGEVRRVCRCRFAAQRVGQCAVTESASTVFWAFSSSRCGFGRMDFGVETLALGDDTVGFERLGVRQVMLHSLEYLTAHLDYLKGQRPILP